MVKISSGAYKSLITSSKIKKEDGDSNAYGVVRLGDLCSGHACFPSRPNIEASSDVFVNGKGVHRIGDAWAIHCCIPSPCHDGVLATGKPTVFCNDRPVGRNNGKDAVSCGSRTLEGSPNVFL